MYKLQDVHGLDVRQSTEYSDAVQVTVHRTEAHAIRVDLTLFDFKQLVAQGLGYLGVTTEDFNLAAFLGAQERWYNDDEDADTPTESWLWRNPG